MKIQFYIPSKNRSLEHTTYFYLKKKGINSKVVVHTEQDKEEYLKHPDMPEEDILVSGAKLGLASNRNAIIKMIPIDKWHAQLSDDATKFTAVEEPYYSRGYVPTQLDKTLQKIYKTEISGERILEIVQETIARSENMNCSYAGFAILDNPYFREKKWKINQFVDGRFILIKNLGLLYDENVKTMDDYEYSAANLLHFGSTLRNDFLCPEFKRYGKGGIGTYQERLKQKIADCNYMMRKYPGLFRYKKKKGCHPLAEMQIRITNSNSLKSWREKLGQDLKTPEAKL